MFTSYIRQTFFNLLILLGFTRLKHINKEHDKY